MRLANLKKNKVNYLKGATKTYDGFRIDKDSKYYVCYLNSYLEFVRQEIDYSVIEEYFNKIVDESLDRIPYSLEIGLEIQGFPVFKRLSFLVDYIDKMYGCISDVIYYYDSLGNIIENVEYNEKFDVYRKRPVVGVNLAKHIHKQKIQKSTWFRNENIIDRIVVDSENNGLIIDENECKIYVQGFKGKVAYDIIKYLDKPIISENTIITLRNGKKYKVISNNYAKQLDSDTDSYSDYIYFYKKDVIDIDFNSISDLELEHLKKKEMDKRKKENMDRDIKKYLENTNANGYTNNRNSNSYNNSNNSVNSGSGNDDDLLDFMNPASPLSPFSAYSVFRDNDNSGSSDCDSSSNSDNSSSYDCSSSSNDNSYSD